MKSAGCRHASWMVCRHHRLLSQFGALRAGKPRACRTIAGRGRSGNRGATAPRKVRTPSGGIAANGRPAISDEKAEEQGHRDESAMRVRFRMHTGTATPYCRRAFACRAWQGETRQPLSGATSNRHAPALCRQGGPPEHAGRWLEHASNGMSRGMIARPGNRVYKIRPIDLFRIFHLGH